MTDQNKPRIYVAITTFYPLVGGAETQTLAQCKRLREKGYEAKVITFHHKKIWQKYETVQGVPVLRVAGALLGQRENLPRPIQRALYLLALFIMGLTIWKHRKQFDVLQVCQCSLLVLPLGLVCLLAKKPMTIVVISAGADKPSKTNEEATLVAGPLDPQASWLRVDGKTWIDGDLYGLQSAGKLIVEVTRALLIKIRAVMIVLSTRMHSYLHANDFDLPGTELIPNGVDIVRFQPINLNTINTSARHTVVCVSKLRYEKGIDILLQAWRIVHIQEPEARLIIIGNGPIQDQLERLANELEIAGSVEFTGLQSDIPQQLHRGLISVLPSRWEGMPNALLEAMSSGLACVATRVSGSEDVIDHGINGLLVQSENYEQMAQALLTLLRNSTLAIQYGQEARKTVEHKYTLDYVMNRYIQVYQRAMNKRETKQNDITTTENCSLAP